VARRRRAFAGDAELGFGLGVFSGVRQQYDNWLPMRRDRGGVIAQLGTLHGCPAFRALTTSTQVCDVVGLF
jgi:hypothetical protein